LESPAVRPFSPSRERNGRAGSARAGCGMSPPRRAPSAPLSSSPPDDGAMSRTASFSHFVQGSNLIAEIGRVLVAFRNDRLLQPGAQLLKPLVPEMRFHQAFRHLADVAQPLVHATEHRCELIGKNPVAF